MMDLCLKMDTLEYPMDAAYKVGPPSPGLSALLSDLVADYAADESASPHQQPIVPEQHPGRAPRLTASGSINNNVSTSPVGPATVFPLAPAGLGGVSHTAQAGGSWSPQLRAQAAPHADCTTASGPPAFVLGRATQPTERAPLPRSGDSSGGTAAAAAAAVGLGAGSRRGRRPLPRLPDLQQQVDALSEQFRWLSRENTFLRRKLQLLECILPYRDSHIGFLASIKAGQPPQYALQFWQQQSASGPAAPRAAPPSSGSDGPAATASAALAAPGCNASPLQPPQPPQPPSSSLAVAAAGVSCPGAGGWLTAAMEPSLGGGGGGGGGGGPPGDMADGAAASGAVAAGAGARVGWAAEARAAPTAYGATPGANSATSLTSAAARPADPPGAACGSWAAAPLAQRPDAPTLLALCPGPDGEVPHITAAAVEELRRVTAREFQTLYKHMVMQIAALSVAAEMHGPASSQHARLERYLDRAFQYMDQVLLLAPECWVQSMYVNLETGERERPSDEFWSALGAALLFDCEQLESIRMATAVHQASVAPVARERLQLASQLSASISAGLAGLGAGQQPVSSGDVLQTLSEVDEVAERLRRNVIKEHQAQVDIGDFLCTRVLTPIQVARLMVGSYPYVPDAVALLHAADPARKPAPPPGGTGRSGASAGAGGEGNSVGP